MWSKLDQSDSLGSKTVLEEDGTELQWVGWLLLSVGVDQDIELFEEVVGGVAGNPRDQIRTGRPRRHAGVETGAFASGPMTA